MAPTPIDPCATYRFAWWTWSGIWPCPGTCSAPGISPGPWPPRRWCSC